MWSEFSIKTYSSRTEKRRDIRLLDLMVYWQNQFRVLKDWEIEFDPDAEYKGQCCFNVENKRATIYGWGTGNIAKDYIFHEMLHIAVKAMESGNKKVPYSERREREENFV